MRASLCSLLILSLCCATAQAQPKPYRLPSVDLKQEVIWGSRASTPEGFELEFGGMRQQPANSGAMTRYRVNGGEWQRLPQDEASISDELIQLTQRWQHIAQELRRAYLADASPQKMDQAVEEAKAMVDGLAKHLSDQKNNPSAGDALNLVKWVQRVAATVDTEPTVENIRQATLAAGFIDQVTSALAREPRPRALSPMVYDPHTKRFVLFGGDHLDYLTNDVWTFDPNKLQWAQHHPKHSPPPRANHQWKVLEGGKLALSGGYTYANNTDYMGGQYIDHDDGEWIYDIVANKWFGKAKTIESRMRVYRTGPFQPDFFLQGDKPNRAAHEKRLAELPVNEWVALDPPLRPHMQRDWGTAVMTPDMDLILRWSGGHCAHGGTDVLHYHIATNRWELTVPVEFPLGQLYTNTEYPAGVSFNGGAWMTGHTYQSYGYDSASQRMWFLGQRENAFAYEPKLGRWTDYQQKPDGMNYNDSFYTLTVTATPQGLVCWTKDGRLFHLPSGKHEWNEWKLTGDKLAGAEVDNSTIVYDSQRDRLYCFRKPYGEGHSYDGVVYMIDAQTKAVSKLTTDEDFASKIPYLCQIRYHADSDLLIGGCTLPPGEDGIRRTPAFDPAKNRWVSLKLSGDDPHGKKGRDVSLGMQYDAKRKLMFAVDTRSQVYVLKFDRATAEAK